MKREKLIWLPCLFLLALTACEKEISVDIPVAEEQVVVDGQIEQGQPPFILLSSSQAPFEPIDVNSFASIFLNGADVRLSNGTETVTLDEICTSDLPEELLDDVSELTGIPPEVIATVDICGYTNLDGSMIGEEGRTYTLEIDYEDHSLRAQTKINQTLELDSLWFSIPNADASDSLGFAYAILDDPDTLGNAYRWFARRVNTYPAWSEHAGEVKDPFYIAPLGSAYDDEFFNGLSFEFAYFRGAVANSGKEDDLNEERGFFKVGDTIAVRGAQIDQGVFRFLSAMEDQIGTGGSPFASPANLPSNVEGGLGLFAGYAAVYDTIICTP